MEVIFYRSLAPGFREINLITNLAEDCFKEGFKVHAWVGFPRLKKQIQANKINVAMIEIKENTAAYLDAPAVNNDTKPLCIICTGGAAIPNMGQCKRLMVVVDNSEAGKDKARKQWNFISKRAGHLRYAEQGVDGSWTVKQEIFGNKQGPLTEQEHNLKVAENDSEVKKILKSFPAAYVAGVE